VYRIAATPVGLEGAAETRLASDARSMAPGEQVYHARALLGVLHRDHAQHVEAAFLAALVAVSSNGRETSTSARDNQLKGWPTYLRSPPSED
jgi:hypothetical protein